jgi:hypothetical protein
MEQPSRRTLAGRIASALRELEIQHMDCIVATEIGPETDYGARLDAEKRFAAYYEPSRDALFH